MAEGIKDNFNDLGNIASSAIYQIQGALLDLFVIAPLTRAAENWASELLQAGGGLFGASIFGGGVPVEDIGGSPTGRGNYPWGRGNQLPGASRQVQVVYNVQSNDPVAVRQVLQESLPQITQAAKQGIDT